MDAKLEAKGAKSHSISLENRCKAILSGIEKVVNSADDAVNLLTSEGGLNIVGKELKIEKYSTDDQTLVLSGQVDSIRYTVVKAPLLKRIFK